jgi:hypothetical protein
MTVTGEVQLRVVRSGLGSFGSVNRLRAMRLLVGCLPLRAAWRRRVALALGSAPHLQRDGDVMHLILLC